MGKFSFGFKTDFKVGMRQTKCLFCQGESGFKLSGRFCGKLLMIICPNERVVIEGKELN